MGNFEKKKKLWFKETKKAEIFLFYLDGKETIIFSWKKL